MSSQIRSLKPVTWKDPLSWLEPMKGAKWNELIKKEQQTYENVYRNYVNHEEATAIRDELTYALSTEQSRWINIGKYLEIQPGGTLSMNWKWIDSSVVHTSADIAVDNQGNVWDVVDMGDGAEKYRIQFWPRGADHHTWEIDSVAPFVLMIHGRCYFLAAKNSLWYSMLASVEAIKGGTPTVHYDETDSKWNLTLVRGENHTGYLIRENSGLQQIFFIAEGVFRKIDLKGFFVVGGGAPNDYFATEGRGTDNWKGHGPRLSRWRLPVNHGIPENVSVHFGLLVTRKQGERYLWKCSGTHDPQLLYHGICNLWLDTLGPHIQDKTLTICTTVPGAYTTTYQYKKELTPLPSLASPYAESKLYHAHHVPYILVKNSNMAVKSLLVVGYGAYGMSTVLNTLRWYPLLLRGWAVCFALVRGGGDDTQSWADAARTYRRELSVLDFETVIEDAQKRVGLTSKETCIYGRSAGGILIGAAAARQTGTSLFSALYGEVPYLDVLRTTTNPRLPLTQLEYDEFGNPTQRLEDLVAVAKISPMEGIPQDGYPGLFALMRTGQNDKEVFAYEPVKWILRARGKKKDTRKLLAFELNEGHFVGGSTGLAHKTSDLALLLAWRRGATFRL
jgi:hypothetical protein